MPFPCPSVPARPVAALWVALAIAGAASAQEGPQEGPFQPPLSAPPTDDLFAPLPPIPEPEALPDVDTAPPIILPPVAPPDPGMLAPLPALGSFDPAPRTDFKFTEVAQEGIRYRLLVEGLAPTGLEGQFRRLSALVRGQNRPATAAQIASRANADEQLLQRLLFSEGWYGATTNADADFTKPERAEIRLTATPGERYTWREITLDLIPDEQAALADGFGLEVGDAIRAIDVEEAEGALLRRLNEAGYPFVAIGARDVVLDQATPTATYLLTGDLGPQGIFGAVRMSGFQPFDEAHAQVIARFEPGEPYDVRLVDDLRRALIATQQFGGVTVTPTDTGLREADGRAVTEIRIQGNRGPQRLLTGQLGYASQEGFRAEGSSRNRSFLRPEGMLTARAVLGTEEQRARTELLISNWRQRDRSLEFSADLANLTPPAFKAQTFALVAEVGRASTPIWQKRWTWAVGFGLGASRERQRAVAQPREDGEAFDERRNFLFVSLPGKLGYDRSNDLLDPTGGYRLNLEVNPEASREGSSLETYARLFADATYYQGLADKLVLAGRLRVGSIVGADLFSIAPTRRLYAGGGGSVRGFDYQEVGDVGLNDRPIGGRGLFESSIEARYRFGAFGVVGFVDAGSVNQSSLPSLDGTRFGVGVGGRYYTSFGPIRIDVARAVNRTARDPVFALYISIGQAF